MGVALSAPPNPPQCASVSVRGFLGNSRRLWVHTRLLRAVQTRSCSKPVVAVSRYSLSPSPHTFPLPCGCRPCVAWRSCGVPAVCSGRARPCGEGRALRWTSRPPTGPPPSACACTACPTCAPISWTHASPCGAPGTEGTPRTPSSGGSYAPVNRSGPTGIGEAKNTLVRWVAYAAHR